MIAERVMPADDPAGHAAAVAAARRELRRGRPVGVPTDTVYGLAAEAANVDAVRHLFDLKERPQDRSIAVLVADVAAAEALVHLTGAARRLARRFWPGPLTIVAARRRDAPPHLGSASSIGVRLPDDELIRAIAAGGPLAVTSANLHGAATPSTAAGVAALFPSVAVVVDGGPRPGVSSTVVDTTGTVPDVLRAGPITAEAILAAVGELPLEER